jgi:flagellar hook-associated protein 1
MGLSVGLNTMMRALMAQQTALDTTSHNIANVNTPGYSRQRVVQVPVAPSDPTQVASPGNGVQTLGIQRIRDLFIDFQRRSDQGSASYYAAKSDVLQLAETTLNEPSGEGSLRQVLTQFFNAFRDLANSPDQSAMRTAVVQAGATLVSVAKNADASLRALETDANKRIAADISEINGLSDQIAGLNKQIIALRGLGDPASDLTDRRDLALDRLSQLADVQYSETGAGALTVTIGGRGIVAGDVVQKLKVTPNVLNNNYFDIQWAADGSAVTVSSGEVGAMLDARDVDIPTRVTELNAVVAKLITDVNTQHMAGYAFDGVTTGTKFFVGNDATDIDVNPAVMANLDLVAAAKTTGARGDGDNALAIAGLQSFKSMAGATQTYDESYNAMVTSLGVEAKNATALSAARKQTVEHLDQLQQSVAGVNLDEEMINLTQYQRGYQAAARVITIINEMLDSLINRML